MSCLSIPVSAFDVQVCVESRLLMRMVAEHYLHAERSLPLPSGMQALGSLHDCRGTFRLAWIYFIDLNSAELDCA
jgi:hypothetical protein